MKRPILITTIGYVIGIIVGLYFKNSIVFLYIPIVLIYIIIKKSIIQKRKFKLFSFKRYIRYLKIFISKKSIILIIISSIISNSIVLIQKDFYQKTYSSLKSQEEICLTGIVISNKIEGKYNNKYIVKTHYNKKKIKLYINVNKNVELQYGEKIKFIGKYINPSGQKNYRGFDYSKYLKQLGIYGTIKIEKFSIISYEQINKFFIKINNLQQKIKNNINSTLDNQTSSLLLGLILGDKTNISEDIYDDFKNANMLHILAISGMHVIYIISGIELLFKKILGKRNTYFLEIIFLFLYMNLTNYSTSIVRAGIMGILMIISKIIFKRNDLLTSMSLSLLILLIYNPFLIENMGLQLSYASVLGISLFNYIINYIPQKTQLSKMILFSIFLQLVIMPIIIYNFNIFTPYFIISSLILSFIIGPIVISSFMYVIISLINLKVSIVFSKIIKFEIYLLILISKISKLPFSKIYVKTPSLFLIICYYILICVIFCLCQIFLSKNPNMSQIRIKNIIALLKIKIRHNKTKIKKIICIICVLVLVIKFIPHNLEIHFIDVGQGDSCLIVTPKNKTILIDGGGNTNFDVGKNTLIPYILDRGFKKIDIAVISHFDDDHVLRNFICDSGTKSR